MTTLRSGVSSYTSTAYPSREFGSPARLYVRQAIARVYLQFNIPADWKTGHATVMSAKLRVQSTAPWSGSTTLSVQRVAKKWLLSKLNSSNAPAVTGTTVAVTKSNAGDNAVWEFDVTADVQAFVNGTSNYGWRIVSSSAAARTIWGFKAAKYKPTLEVVYSYGPATPTTLHPSAGAVSVAKPRLRFDAGEITALRVQVDPAANATTPAFDSGWVASTLTEFDLNASSYAGLADGASASWRVQVQDSTGQTSAWSQWATFSRAVKPALSITQPGPVVSESSPPIVFSMIGLAAYQVTIARADDPTTVLYDSGLVPSTWGVLSPASVITEDGRSYVVTVRAYDGVDREGTAGDPVYVEGTVTTTLAYSATVAGVDWIGADQAGVTPWVDVTWGRAIQPDGWVILRDGVQVAQFDTANDALITGSTYTWRDWTAKPNLEHIYRVAPVVNGVTSSAGPIAGATTSVDGVWLGDPVTGRDVVLWGDDAGSWAYGSDVTVYSPIGASVGVRVTTSLRGLEGAFTALRLVDAEGDSYVDYGISAAEAILWDFKSEPDLEVRLVAGDINVPVSLFDVAMWPDPVTNSMQRAVNVSFGFAQTGELPFSVKGA